MRKLIALLLLCLAVFVVVYRQRIYVWDPMATVTRDGVKQQDARVMINYPNDVLMDDSGAGKHRIYLVQHWNKVAGFPAAGLKCIQWLACMTDADQATATPLTAGSRGRREAFEGVTMTSRRVEFVDEDGALVQVMLR